MSTTNKKRPTPEELQREFEAFLKQKYGDSVKFSVSSPNVESEPASSPPPKKRTAADLKFDYKPKEVNSIWIALSSGRMKARRPWQSAYVTTIITSKPAWKIRKC